MRRRSNKDDAGLRGRVEALESGLRDALREAAELRAAHDDVIELALVSAVPNGIARLVVDAKATDGWSPIEGTRGVRTSARSTSSTLTIPPITARSSFRSRTTSAFSGRSRWTSGCGSACCALPKQLLQHPASAQIAPCGAFGSGATETSRTFPPSPGIGIRELAARRSPFADVQNHV